MTNQTIRTVRQPNGTERIINRLSDDWAPWKYQIATFVQDGKSYGRPAQRTRVGWINFETEADAQKWLDA